jgi:hypothetical protein
MSKRILAVAHDRPLRLTRVELLEKLWIYRRIRGHR